MDFVRFLAHEKTICQQGNHRCLFPFSHPELVEGSASTDLHITGDD